jgi:hypothetical protein
MNDCIDFLHVTKCSPTNRWIPIIIR